MGVKKIKVMIVDDHMVMRRGLRHIIQTFKDVERVAEAGGGEEALLRCRQHRPDVVLMVAGLSNVDIAEHLTISLSTARYHVSTVLTRLNVSNRTEAVTYAIKHGLMAT